MIRKGSSWAGRQVLIVGSDSELVDAVRRCAVACGVEVTEAVSLGQARSVWMSSTFVVVLDEVANERRVEVMSRPRVVVVTRDSATSTPWRMAVDVGAEQVLDLSIGDTSLVEYFTQESQARARVVSVVGGSGGAGASITAAALVLSARSRGQRCVLVDADHESSGADLLLGLDETPGLRWHHLSPSAGPPPGEQLFSSLPRSGECAVITRDRGDRSGLDISLIRSTIRALHGVVDLIVVDIPRGAIELRAELAVESDVVFVVVTCDLRGATSARPVVDSIRDHADVRLLARRSRGDSLTPPDIREWLDLPLGAVLPNESGITSSIDRGEPICGQRRSRLIAACSSLLTEWEL